MTRVSVLERIARALERLAPAPVAEADPERSPAMRWDGRHLLPVTPAPVLPAERFVGVDAQILALRHNLTSLARGGPAHDMLLWGARGMGKSALVRTLSAEAGLGLVECAGPDLPSLPLLFARLAELRRPLVVFVDDVAFRRDDPALRLLRSLLDGGAARRPEACRLAVTSNHRHLVVEDAPSEARHPRDAAEDRLALVDRFGLVLGFHPPDQAQYLEMCRRHLAACGLELDEGEALAFALARGGRSGRTAWHHAQDRAVRAGQDGPCFCD
ncbi:MAG: ATP-binding protein [Sphingomonadaceae bacterium]|uniref:DUF815 domain-containing protein n=1 Tax=Thermaurantiacus sp. TaxID=2820283 RepID=UPI00298ED659|nr:DUF815 domain-containing protein [Thermaurantiacus sp.]MCS6986387.1 ATP-binding protein [Sphingomonadaceae bacterium]MDW8414351.1 DUF815 domain-containing protein [Thermaurantiacus sp.]